MNLDALILANRHKQMCHFCSVYFQELVEVFSWTYNEGRSITFHSVCALFHASNTFQCLWHVEDLKYDLTPRHKITNFTRCRGLFYVSKEKKEQMMLLMSFSTSSTPMCTKVQPSKTGNRKETKLGLGIVRWRLCVEGLRFVSLYLGGGLRGLFSI